MDSIAVFRDPKNWKDYTEGIVLHVPIESVSQTFIDVGSSLTSGWVCGANQSRTTSIKSLDQLAIGGLLNATQRR
jgi:hypothetical protein